MLARSGEIGGRAAFPHAVDAFGRLKSLGVRGMQEGTQSEWLYLVLSPHATEVPVIGMRIPGGPVSRSESVRRSFPT